MYSNRILNFLCMVKFTIFVLVLILGWGVCIPLGGAMASNPITNEYSPSEEQESFNEQYGLGTVPGRIDLNSSTQIELRANPTSINTIPAQYDLRNFNKLSPVRNQGSYGACWAFGALGSLESCLLPGEVCDFSENNMSNHRVKDDTETEGGDIWDAISYLARWQGPVDETQDPYVIPHQSSPSDLLPTKHVQNIRFLYNRKNSIDNNEIKLAIMQYGAVCSAFYWSDSFYSDFYNSYYCSTRTNSNHMIDIVGWDDNFPNTHFANIPTANGAFLCRNSWGTDWGDGGYFWISYYDLNLACSNNNAVFLNAEPVNNYEDIYQYDPLGMISNYNYNDATAWGANVFKARSNAGVAAVSTYIIGTGTLDIYIYRNPGASPTDGTLINHTHADIDAAGYHTIPLDVPPTLAAGERFSVVIKYYLPPGTSNVAKIPVEAGWLYGISPTANPGESFVSHDGSNWRDMTTIDSDSNVCIKAFTKAAEASIEYVQSICAENGTIRVDLSESPTVHPQPGDFYILQSINDSDETSIRASIVNVNGSSVSLTIPIIKKTTIDQSVVIKISYRKGPVIAAAAFVVSAMLKAAIPVAEPPEGPVLAGTQVKLSTTTSGANIYYTLNETSPSDQSIKYESPIIINAATTIKAIAIMPDMINSDVMTATYSIQKVATPVADPEGGEVPAGTTVKLSTATEDAVIYYTADGSDPTQYGIEYVDPLVINAAQIIQAIATKPGMTTSDMLTASYILKIPDTVIENDWRLDKNYDLVGDLIVNHGVVYLYRNTLNVRGSVLSSSGIDLNSGQLNVFHNLNITDGSVDINYGQLNVFGNLLLSKGTVDLKGGQINVFGNLLQSGGNLNIDGGLLHVYGNYYMQNLTLDQNGTPAYADCWARILMKSSADKVFVDKDLIVASLYSHSNNLVNGTIEIKGNFTQKFTGTYSNFAAGGSHKVILSGSGFQTISFDNPNYSHFNSLENNSTGTIHLLTPVHYSKDFNGNNTNIANAENLSYVTYQPIAMPAFNVSKNERKETGITLSCSTEGTHIYYTTDGTVPTSDSIPYTAPIIIKATTNLKAIAILGVDDRSDIMSDTIYTDECFIATAAFGSKFQPEVTLLRYFRDDYLLTNRIGQAFVRFYYHNSPPIANYIAGNEVLKGITRMLLSPFVAVVYVMYHPGLALSQMIVIVFLVIYVRKRRAKQARFKLFTTRKVIPKV